MKLGSGCSAPSLKPQPVYRVAVISFEVFASPLGHPFERVFLGFLMDAVAPQDDPIFFLVYDNVVKINFVHYFVNLSVEHDLVSPVWHSSYIAASKVRFCRAMEEICLR